MNGHSANEPLKLKYGTEVWLSFKSIRIENEQDKT